MSKFSWEDRKHLLTLLQQFEATTRREGIYGPLLDDLAAIVQGVIPDAEITFVRTHYPDCAGMLAFSGNDGARYFANASGLWVFGSQQGNFVVTPQKWWMGVLNTRVFWSNVQRKSKEVEARSRRFLSEKDATGEGAKKGGERGGEFEAAGTITEG